MISTMGFRARLLTGAALGVLFAGSALAQNPPPRHRHHAADGINARLERMEHGIEEQQAKIHRWKNQVGNSEAVGTSGGATQAAANQPAEVSDSQVQQIEAE